MAKVRKKLWYGNPPVDGVLLAQSNGWALYERPMLSKAGWRTIKLVSTVPRLFKANYHLGWLLEEKRLSRGSEAVALRQNDPGVYAWAEGVLSNEHFS